MKILRVLAIGATIGGVALATAHEKVNAEEWTPRTVEQIKADMKGNEYTIVWGDTLSGISQVTNISVQKLADMNKIANVDLIYAGNKLVFNGNVATVQNNKGETVAQSVIQPQDKVDSTKPVGQPVQNTTSNNTTNSATQNTTTPLTDNTVTGNTQTGGQTTGNTETTTPSTPENNGGTTQTPTQPSQPGNNGNQNGSTGGNTGGGQTTPSNPGNNEGNQGGSTGGNGGTTPPEQPEKPQEPTIVAGKVGNSGMIFITENEAYDWADQQTSDHNSVWFNKGFVVSPIIYSDDSQKYTIDFY
ncbi:LysM peptidoglycan-binding domain-containing protein [Enterococcus faecium]|uniref:LysM peptidoglycan-binding domain-containing protein n=1 Tax=Enterococcus faecium TaxID=1352 RepID=UPI00177AEE8E|nr:LysM domain-containing protein [Enterococcus faecium]MBD9940681.1 LysM peptidoglycan-binding domain-containing protein [Enterococcus faecium]